MFKKLFITTLVGVTSLGISSSVLAKSIWDEAKKVMDSSYSYSTSEKEGYLACLGETVKLSIAGVGDSDIEPRAMPFINKPYCTFVKFAQAMRYAKQENYTMSFKLFKPLAEQGFMEAQSVIASLYFDGAGVKQNRKLAKMWWQKAAAQGDKISKEALQKNF